MSCELVFAWPQPSAGDLRDFYSSPDYFKSENEALGYSSYCDLENQHITIARRQLQILKQYQFPGRLLDYGCAYGHFVAQAINAGYDPYGVDWSSEAIQYGQQHIAPTRLDTIESLIGVDSASFDILTLWNVVEHLLHPKETLSELARLLKSHGILALSTPNGSNWTARRNPQHYHEYKPPEHLNIYRLSTIKSLLESCGFSIIRADYLYPVHHQVVASPWAEEIRQQYKFSPSAGTRWLWKNRRRALPAYWVGIYSFNLVNYLVNRLTEPIYTNKVLEVYARKLTS